MKCVGFTCGDVIGQPVEFDRKKYVNYIPFSMGGHFTDDTVMSIAVMEWLINGELTHEALIEQFVKYGHKYLSAGYGQSFKSWLLSKNDHKPYNSWGNGSGMRVSPVGWYFNNEEDVLKYAKISAEVTHNHEEGIKGAQAIAISVYLARNGYPKDEIKKYIEEKFGYDLNRTTDDIRPTYYFHVDCQQSVPESIICFLEAGSTVEAIQLAISLGGDTDTMACMAGAIAEAYYHDANNLFDEVINQTADKIYPQEFVDTISKFNEIIDEREEDNRLEKLIEW